MPNRWITCGLVLLIGLTVVGCGEEAEPAKPAMSEAEREEVETALSVAKVALEDGRITDAADELAIVAAKVDRLPDDLLKRYEILQAAYDHAWDEIPVEEDLPPLTSDE